MSHYLEFYEQREVLAITGIKAATLQNWANRRIVELEHPNPGRQAKRLYSALDIYKIGFLNEMGRLGLAPFVANQLFEYVEDALRIARDEQDWDFDEWDYQSCLFIFRHPEQEGDFLSFECYSSRKTGYLVSFDEGSEEEKPVDISQFEGAIFFRLDAFMSKMHRKILEIQRKKGEPNVG